MLHRYTLVTVFVMVFAWGSARAEETEFRSVLDNRLTVYGGVLFFQAEGDFSSTKEDRPKIKLDMNDLGLDETQSTYTAGAQIAITKRLALRLDYFGYHDDGSNTAEFDFNFEDIVIPVGARVESSVDLDLYVANLGFSFLHTPRARFGVGIGTHVADFSVEVSGKVTGGGNSVDLGSEKEEFLAPLPNLYAFGAYAFRENLVLRYGGGWMSMNYQDFDGDLTFVYGFMEYWPFRYVGIGAGYRYLKADVTYETDSKKETYDISLPGPVVYLAAGF